MDGQRLESTKAEVLAGWRHMPHVAPHIVKRVLDSALNDLGWKRPHAVAASKPIHLEAGKYYRLRNGRVVGPIKERDRRSPYPFGLSGTHSWTETGSWWANGPLHQNDIVAEAPPPGVCTPPTASPLKIEAGKYYVTRRGEIVGPLRKSYETGYAWRGEFENGSTSNWTAAGKYRQYGFPSMHDLVALVPEKYQPRPATVPVQLHKTYRLRNGQIATITGEWTNAEFPFAGTVRNPDDRVPTPDWWTSHGEWRANGLSTRACLDAIAEIASPAPAPIRMEIGKRYRLRNGEITPPVHGIKCMTANGYRFRAQWEDNRVVDFKIDGKAGTGYAPTPENDAIEELPDPVIGCLNIYQKPWGTVAVVYPDRAAADAAHVQGNRIACIDPFSYTPGEGV